MKIKLISDLHLEFGVSYQFADFSEPDSADVIVLAGDVTVGASRVFSVLEYYSNVFKHVVYVPGNHEYYGNTVENFDRELESSCTSLHNVYVLNPGHVVIDDVLFVGAPLWTKFGDDWFAERAAGKMINDFRVIKDFSTVKAKQLYYDHWNYIVNTLAACEGMKTCVVTHFLPAEVCIAPQFQGSNDLINRYFANNLDNWIYDYGPDLWMFGHTHVPVDTVLNRTRLVCNPRGYPNSNEGRRFNPHFEVTL